jgi:hypothetical protein
MRRALSWTALIALAIAVSGCQAFFSTSLASGLTRSSVTVPADISNSQAADLIASTDDPAILAALLAVLNDQAAAGDAGAAALAAEAAVGASGASDAIMEVILPAIAGTVPDAATIATLVGALVAGGSADVLTGLDGLSDPAVLAASAMTPTELVVASLLLAASAMPPGVTDPSTLTAPQLTAFQADPAVVLALSLANKASADILAGGGDPAMADAIAAFLPME